MANLLSTLGPIIFNIFVAFTFSLILWKKTILSDIAEETLIATGLAMILVSAVQHISSAAITPLLNGKIILIIPIILGLFTYGQFSNKTIFLSRYPLTLVLGVGLSIMIRTGIETVIMKNLAASILPIAGMNLYTQVNNVIMIVAFISTMLYFIFTRPSTGVLNKTQKIGRYFMMIFFGTSFGIIVMARLTNLLSVLNMFLKNFHIIS